MWFTPCGLRTEERSTTIGDSDEPDVAATASGRFFVGWRRQFGSDSEVRFLLVEGDGTSADLDQLAGSNVNSTVHTPRAGAGSLGILVAWEYEDTGLLQTGIRATFVPRIVP